MTLVVSPWQVFLYFACVLGTVIMVAWFSYDLGRKAGRSQERIRSEARMKEVARPIPRNYMQRNPHGTEGGVGRQSTARVIARKQTPTEPRREKRRKQQ